MNSLDVNDPNLKSQPSTVGIENNRLVVNTRPTDYGTFAVTTAPWTDNNFPSDKVYQMIPYQKATSFRINNHTGKTIGVRRRHNKIVVDDFEDQNHSDWTGTVTGESNDIDGFYSASIKSLAHRPLTTVAMLDGSEVEIKFRTPNTDNAFTVDIKVWDDPSRIGAGNSAGAFSSSSLAKNKEYKLIFRLRPTENEYDVYLESPERAEITAAGTGEFGTANMVNSIISVECTSDLVVDSIVYQQKTDFSVEQLLSPSSMVYPCEDNISEYEVINLGSDALNYSDTNVNVTLSGFYAV